MSLGKVALFPGLYVPAGCELAWEWVLDKPGNEASIEVFGTREYMGFQHSLWFPLLTAADGLALGAAAGLSKVDVELIIFFAIMLHKVRVPCG